MGRTAWTLGIAMAAAALVASGCDSGNGGDADALTPDVPADVPAPGPFGFTIRVPQVRQVPTEDYEGGTSTTEGRDTDHVCTFPATFPRTYLYVQATPVRFRMMMGAEYETTGAWVSVDGAVQAVEGVAYDWGGNHHNDSVVVSWQGKVFRFYHSSFGFGWRRCQPMDCVQGMAADGVTVEDDGCTTDRTIPVACVEVDEAGGVPAFPTTFEKCLGDPNLPGN